MNHATQMTDLDLFGACVALDRAAQGEFTRRFRSDIGRWIRQTAWRRGRGLPAADVEDLAQDVFTRLLADDCRRIAQFDGRNGCQPRSWLRVVTQRLTLNHLRRRSNWTTSLDDAPPVVDPGPDPVERMLARADGCRRARLQAAVDALSPADRALLTMYLEQGLSAPDIARRLDIKVGAVYTRKCRLVNRLRRMVAREAA